MVDYKTILCRKCGEETVPKQMSEKTINEFDGKPNYIIEFYRECIKCARRFFGYTLTTDVEIEAEQKWVSRSELEEQDRPDLSWKDK